MEILVCELRELSVKRLVKNRSIKQPEMLQEVQKSYLRVILGMILLNTIQVK
jgi:hypothetical protein